jgi:putative protein-disulfide isomerase
LLQLEIQCLDRLASFGRKSNNARMSESSSAQLFYVSDPMCSWCWGFREALLGVEPGLHSGVTLRLVMGGLAPDDDGPMDPATREYIRSAWHSVAAKTGARFNHDFWKLCQPRRSTWPACRAVLAAEAHSPGLGHQMFAAIQHAYYLEARNPSDLETLVQLAAEIGILDEAFAERINAPETREQLDQDFALRDKLGTRGYPSLALETGGGLEVLTRGYVSRASLQALLAERGLLAKVH